MAFDPFEINKGLVDWWSLSHFTTGFIGGTMGLSLPLMLLLGAAWEGFEWWGKANAWPVPWIHPAQDSAVHIAADTTVFVAGWWLGKKMRKHYKELPHG